MRNRLMMTTILGVMTASAAIADTSISKSVSADVNADGVADVTRSVTMDKDVNAGVRMDADERTTTTYRSETYVDRTLDDDATGINPDAHVVADVDGAVGLGTPMDGDNSVEVQTKTRSTTVTK